MKFIKIKDKSVEQSRKVYREKFGVPAPETFELPLYKMVDDDNNPIVVEKKRFDGEKIHIDKTEVIVSQDTLNNYRKMGQHIEIIDVKKIEAEKAALDKLIAEAEKRGYEKAKNEAKK